MTLELDRLRCRYRRQDRPALADLTLVCRAPEICCLVGPNGAGKSTALATVAGLSPPSGGEIRFEGSRLAPLSPPRGLGYLPQRSVFPAALTVAEVLEFSFAARSTPSQAREETLALGDLEEVLEVRAGALSSGWSRRLGLSLAMLAPCRLLLLDEPFVGLDLATLERCVQALCERARAGTVVLLASHDFEVVDRLQARVAVLDEGRLLAVESAVASSRALYQKSLEPALPVRARGEA